MKYLFYILIALTSVNFAFNHSGVVRMTPIQYPDDWPEPIYDFSSNPVTEKGYVLGRYLFHDPNLSRDGTISCASCHSQYNGFTHVDHKVSHGIEDRKGTRNSPVLINLAWNDSFHWDGGVNHLNAQPLNPIKHPAEMDNSLDSVLFYLNSNIGYRGLFFDAFGDSSATTSTFLKALAQYNVSLVSAQSNYDKFREGSYQFTSQEFNGYYLFQKHCNSCHTEPLFNSNKFANNGLNLDSTYMDLGRYAITKLSEDSLKFRVPTLRNIAYSFPYMHDGRFRKLKDVIDHYTDGIDIEDPLLSEELRTPIKLTDNEKKDLLAFLYTLTDRAFLFNTKFSPPR